MDARPRVSERYLFGPEIGRGAFATVYRGADRSNERAVAIKCLREVAPDPSALARFWHEAEILQRIVHPGIVRCVDQGVDDRGRPALVMEWLDGQDLHAWQRSRPLDVNVAIELFRQVALGLHALHEAGVVHRDIKPSNLFVTTGADGQPAIKILDLGIARSESSRGMTLQGLRIGTPAYMSPEQARGDETIGPASDLFSLGVVMFEMLGGRRPFEGRDPFAVLAKIVLHEPPRLRTVAPDLHPEIEALVARLLAKEPALRYPSALALADALEHLPASSGITWAPRTEGPTDAEATAHVPQLLEQRVVTLVFARVRVPETDLPRLESLAHGAGAVSHRAIGGHAVAIFGRTHAAGDEVERAGRFALRIAEDVQGIELAIATAKVPAHEAGLPADLLERGAASLAPAKRGIPVDAATARLMGSHFSLENDGQQTRLNARARSTAVPVTLFQTMIGRERELLALQTTLDECIDEPVARVVRVIGPAGIGKSRLALEFVESIARRAPHAVVWTAVGEPMRAGAPFALASSIAQQALGATGDTDLDPSFDRDVAAEDRPRVLGFLGELAGVRYRGEIDEVQLAAARRDPVLMGDQIRRAFVDYVSARVRRHPVVIVLEDLQWGDLPSAKLVEALLSGLRDAPLFVAAFARPEVTASFPGLFAEHAGQEIRLGELPRRAVERLVRAALGDRTDATQVSQLVDGGAGNPFVIEERIRAELEGRRTGLPDSVLALVQHRLDALGDDGRRVARAASVFGAACSRDGLAAALEGELHGERVDEVLGDLVDHAVLARESSTDKPRIVFRHALLREAAYDTLAESDRIEKHARIGAWLEAAGGAEPIVLAEHFERGHQPQRAVGWFHRASEAALAGNDFDSVLSRVERALACGGNDALRGALELVRAEALKWRGDYVAFEASADRAMRLLPSGSERWCRAAGERSGALAALGRHDDLARLGETMLSVESTADRAAFIAEGSRVVVGLYAAVRYAEADALLDRIEQSQNDSTKADPAVACRIHRARASRALVLGDTAAYLHALESALEAYMRAGNIRAACVQRSDIGFAWIQLGRFADAEQTLRRALSDATRMALPIIAALARQNLGLALGYMGRLDEALSLEREAADVFHAHHIGRVEASCRALLAHIALARGEIEHAEREARAACQLAEKLPAIRSLALGMLGRALAAAGSGDEAFAASGEGIDVLEKLGGGDEHESLIRAARVEVLMAIGREEDAVREARRFRERIEIRAGKISDETLRGSFVRGVPEHAMAMALTETVPVTQ